MPNEKSSSFSSSNLCFWASARMLYVICLVSTGFRDGRSSGRSLPCILILGAEPAVICRSEPLLSIITFKRSCRPGTFLGSVISGIVSPCLDQGNHVAVMDQGNRVAVNADTVGLLHNLAP